MSHKCYNNSMKEFKISIFVTNDGKSPFLDWLNSIKDVQTQRRIRLRIDRLTLGNFGDTKSVGDNLFELRLFFGAGYRVYYTIEDEHLVILFSGGDKSTQTKDIEKAKAYLLSYKGVHNDKK